MKVLITGGGGFIGSHLVDSQLAYGHDVRSVDLNQNLLVHVPNSPNLEIVTGDITKEEIAESIMEGIEVVYHLASAHLDVSLSEERYHTVNVNGTINLLKAAHAAGVRRFVHCSSVGVMGDIKNPPADESYPCNPTNIYEKTKLSGEREALKYSREMDFPVVVVRPAWVYGPRCPRTKKLFQAIGKKRFPIFGNGQNLRHPIYVADCVRGLELCAETDNISGEVFIIAGREPVSIEDLARAISEALNVPAPKFYLPMALGKFAGVCMQFIFKPLGRQPPFSMRSLDFYQKNNSYDISKARWELDFTPQFDLQTGLEQTVSYQEELSQTTEVDDNRLWMKP